MTMKKNFSLAMIAVFFMGLFFFGQVFLEPKNYISYRFNSVFNPVFASIQNIFNGSVSRDEFSNLILENERLKAQLLVLSKSPREHYEDDKEYRAAKVYSTYPFNNKGLMAINAGLKDGMTEFMPVTIGGYILIGQIMKAESGYSVVRTVFDNGWQLPVKVGDDNVDALLVGGREVKLTLIVRDKKIEPDDTIYAASKDFPYGLTIGSVKEIQDEAGSAFKSATVSLPYELSKVIEVDVLIR